MTNYTVPLDNIYFVLNDVLNVDNISGIISERNEKPNENNTPNYLKVAFIEASNILRFIVAIDYDLLHGGAKRLSFAERAYQETHAAADKSISAQKKLLDMKTNIEGSRALLLDAAVALDLLEKHPEPVVRENAAEYAALILPVMNNDAMDFLLKKVLDMKDLGNRLGLFMNPLYQEIKATKANPKLSAHAETLEGTMKIFQQTMMGLVQAGMSGKTDEIIVHADDFMTMFEKMALGRMWLKMMSAAQNKLDQGASGAIAGFYEDKLTLGDYYLNNVMTPIVKKLEMRIEAGAPNSSTSSLSPDSATGVARSPDKKNRDNGFTFNF